MTGLNVNKEEITYLILRSVACPWMTHSTAEWYWALHPNLDWSLLPCWSLQKSTKCQQWDSDCDILWAINLVNNQGDNGIHPETFCEQSIWWRIGRSWTGLSIRMEIPSPSISVHHSGAWFQNVLPLYMGYTPTQQLTGYTPTQQLTLKPVYPDLSKQCKTHLFFYIICINMINKNVFRTQQ